MRFIRAWILFILYATLLVGYSSFHAGHALLHTLKIHVHAHHDHHHLADHHHLLSAWFNSAHDHDHEKEHTSVEIFPLFIFAQAFEEVPFPHRVIRLLGYGIFQTNLFQDVCIVPPTPPPVIHFP